MRSETKGRLPLLHTEELESDPRLRHTPAPALSAVDQIHDQVVFICGLAEGQYSTRAVVFGTATGGETVVEVR